jgi:hypothetical protein
MSTRSVGMERAAQVKVRVRQHTFHVPAPRKSMILRSDRVYAMGLQPVPRGLLNNRSRGFAFLWQAARSCSVCPHDFEGMIATMKW